MNTIELIHEITSHPEYTNVVIGDEGDRSPLEAIQRIADEPDAKWGLVHETNEPGTLLIYTKPTKQLEAIVVQPKVAIGSPCFVRSPKTPYMLRGKVVDINLSYRVYLTSEDGVRQFGTGYISVSDAEIEPLIP